MAHLISSILKDKEFISVNSITSVKECAELMAMHKIGSLPVKDSHTDQIIGIISERDMTRNLVAKGLNADTLNAVDIAYTDFNLLDSHESIEKAMTTITETKRRHLLITEGGKVVSILSIGDLMKHVLEEKLIVIEQLENYINS